MGITANEILIPKKTFKTKTEKELDLDTPLADYCPDISRLIRVDCTPFTESCILENDKAVITGKAVYDVLYETDHASRLKFCSFTQEFTHNVSVPRPSGEKPTIYCNVKCERINCKLLSPRRITMKALLSAELNIESRQAIKAVLSKDDSETFFRTKDLKYLSETQCHQQTYNFSDSLSLTQNEKSIGEILCGNIFLQQPQITLSAGKAEIKTSASIRALCEEESQEGSYYIASKVLPLNFEYRNDAIEEGKNLSVWLTPADLQLSPELDQYGESRMIKTDFAVKMRLRLNEQVICTVAEDMFEKHFDSTPVFITATLPEMISKQETGFSAESKLSEMFPHPTSILDSDVRENMTVAEKTDDGINVSGNFTVTLLTNTQEGIYSFDHIIPYSQFIPMNLPVDCNDIFAETYPIEVIATLHSDGSATARIIAGTKISAYTESQQEFISDVTKRTQIEETDDVSALIYCFPEKGEDLWSIAKSYRANPQDIAKYNPESFSEKGNLENQKPILIKT